MSHEISYSMNAETEGGPVVGYMCRIDWEYEIGAACGGNRVYGSVDDLKREHNCASDCGIVEVEVHFRRIVEPGSPDYGAFSQNS